MRSETLEVLLAFQQFILCVTYWEIVVKGKGLWILEFDSQL